MLVCCGLVDWLVGLNRCLHECQPRVYKMPMFLSIDAFNFKQMMRLIKEKKSRNWKKSSSHFPALDEGSTLIKWLVNMSSRMKGVVDFPLENEHKIVQEHIIRLYRSKPIKAIFNDWRILFLHFRHHYQFFFCVFSEKKHFFKLS